MSYQDYQKSQLETFHSHEHDIPRWAEGQKRFIQDWFAKTDREAHILDIACGDGIGLECFKAEGFANVEGFEWSANKAELAKRYGYRVHAGDMHDLSRFPNASFDIVYSSHTLEHAFSPGQVLAEFRRILNPYGELVLVLPYPDTGPDEAHCAKKELGTDISDSGMTFSVNLLAHGFRVTSMKFDSYREPEIWARCKPL